MIVRQVTLLPQPDSPTMPERLALLDGEADAVDGLDDAVVGAEVRLEVVDLEQRHSVEPQASLIRGSIKA